MRFDPSGMYSAFDRMRENAAVKGKTLAEEQTQIFLRALKRESWKIAPSKQELFDTAQRLNWRLKRKKGVSPAKELKRRMRARGTFARGWKIMRVQSERWRIRIWMIDMSSESEKVDNKKGVSKKVTGKVGGVFKRKLENLSQTLSNQFNGR